MHSIECATLIKGAKPSFSRILLIHGFAVMLTIRIRRTNGAEPGAVDAGYFTDALLTITEQTGEEDVINSVERCAVAWVVGVVESNLRRGTRTG